LPWVWSRSSGGWHSQGWKYGREDNGIYGWWRLDHFITHPLVVTILGHVDHGKVEFVVNWKDLILWCSVCNMWFMWFCNFSICELVIDLNTSQQCATNISF
jgi:hypothetical protein